jgi:hypothetical protein
MASKKDKKTDEQNSTTTPEVPKVSEGTNETIEISRVGKGVGTIAPGTEIILELKPGFVGFTEAFGLSRRLGDEYAVKFADGFEAWVALQPDKKLATKVTFVACFFPEISNMQPVQYRADSRYKAAEYLFAKARRLKIDSLVNKTVGLQKAVEQAEKDLASGDAEPEVVERLKTDLNESEVALDLAKGSRRIEKDGTVTERKPKKLSSNRLMLILFAYAYFQGDESTIFSDTLTDQCGVDEDHAIDMADEYAKFVEKAELAEKKAAAKALKTGTNG